MALYNVLRSGKITPWIHPSSSKRRGWGTGKEMELRRGGGQRWSCEEEEDRDGAVKRRKDD
eukprot:2717724-Rhodomonas_salina.1